MKRLKSLPVVVLLPFAIALYPVVQIFASNQNQLAFRQLVGPVFVSLLLAGIVLVIMYALLRSLIKASLATSIVMAESLFYLLWYDRYNSSIETLGSISTRLNSATLFIILSTAFVVGVIIFIWRTKKNLQRPAEVLLVIITALIAVTGVQIIRYNLANRRADALKVSSPLATASGTAPADAPDVYYIILDRHADSRTLSDTYKYDNSAFINNLKSKGFAVTDSYANYPFTVQSLASSLNSEYLPQLTPAQQNVVSSNMIFSNMIQYNGAAQFFLRHGYSYINLASWWDATGYNAQATSNLRYGRGITILGHLFRVSDFGAVIMRQSIMAPIIDKKLMLFGKTIFATDISALNLHANNASYEFNKLNSAIPAAPGPKFVFAHILMPHPPYVFDANGNPTDDLDHNTDKGYIDQMKYTDQKMVGILDNIIKNSKKPPVIVVQADEGPYPARFDGHTDTFNWKDATPAELQQKTGILNAYFMPGQDMSSLPPTISPVNTFRQIIDRYFGGNLPILPDKYYIDNSWTPYKFLPVTGQPDHLTLSK